MVFNMLNLRDRPATIVDFNHLSSRIKDFASWEEIGRRGELYWNGYDLEIYYGFQYTRTWGPVDGDRRFELLELENQESYN